VSDRLGAILEVLMSYAQHQDFTPRIPVSHNLDEIDAIATGINLLAEELQGEVASRRELESVLARLRSTQAQLLVAEKFAAVGQLAAGVAHELNNPAAWVLVALGTLERRVSRAKTAAAGQSAVLDELTSMDRVLSDAVAGLERMRNVIADLRTLSRAPSDASVPVDLDDLVRTTCQLSRPAYLSVADLVLDLGNVPAVAGDRNRLGQLVTNLVINAAYAVAERPGPHQIIVSTRLINGLVLLAVEDTGPGIPEALWERVFDPYFTTKPADVGTGLGLALVRGIVERHGGSVRIVRGSLSGARVEVSLPVAPPGIIVPSLAAPSALAMPASRGRILLIDDEPMLLRTLEEAVAESHDVVTAIGGAAAIDLLATDQRFDLIVCDLQMPHVDGVAVHDALTSSAPDLVSRFVVMSGGAVTPRAKTFLDRARPRSLGKPIELDELLELARTAVG
jgi:signal transduction histidine kinase/CheY-like chemotaxis protein